MFLTPQIATLVAVNNEYKNPDWSHDLTRVDKADSIQLPAFFTCGGWSAASRHCRSPPAPSGRRGLASGCPRPASPRGRRTGRAGP